MVSSGKELDWISQDDITNFQFQRLGTHSLQIFMDRLCKLKAMMQS